MKRIVFFILALIVFAGCSKSRSGKIFEDVKVPENIKYKNVRYEMSEKGATGDDPLYTYVLISYPEIVSIDGSKSVDKINSYIKKRILKSDYSGKSFSNVADLMNEFMKENEELKKSDSGASSNNWAYENDVRITYGNESIATFACYTYLFTGGAHSSSVVEYINFDLKRGRVISLKELFDRKNFELVTAIAEKKFRKEKDLDAEESLNAKGFTFKDDRFALSENYAFTEKGILFYYNPYDIAPYSEGSTEIELSYKEISDFLKDKNLIKK